MRLRGRRSSARLTPVRESAVHRAALEQAIVLDEAQRRAALSLEGSPASLYLWGPVGRGKSWLMDTYLASLPPERVLRVHFHEFFRDLHLALRRHHHDLAAALDELLGRVELLCFDEFHVHDPADGVFIARSLPALLERRIRLIVTSNYPPHSLMPNPLFHDGFVPTIELIERSLTVVAVDGPLDYRTVSAHLAGFAAGWWVSPGTAEQRRRLGLPDAAPCPGSGAAGTTYADYADYAATITVSPAGHPIRAFRAADSLLWIDFHDLCEDTTAPTDYLGLARRFDTWVIDGIPDLRRAGREPTQRFANVVDVLYDRDITTTFVASTSLDRLAVGESAPLDLDRVMSRLGQLRQFTPNPAGQH